MKAVILAGGKSNRMGSEIHKSLLEYRGKRIANHVIDSLNSAEIYDIAFVVKAGDKGVFERYLPSRISYVDDPVCTGPTDAVYYARDFVANETFFIVGMGDTILRSEDIERLAKRAHFTITSIRIPESRGLAKVIKDAAGNVVSLDRGYHTNCYIHSGYSLVNQKFLGVIPRTQTETQGTEKHIETALNQYIQEGGIIQDLQIDWWKHFTNREDLIG